MVWQAHTHEGQSLPFPCLSERARPSGLITPTDFMTTTTESYRETEAMLMKSGVRCIDALIASWLAIETMPPPPGPDEF